MNWIKKTDKVDWFTSFKREDSYDASFDMHLYETLTNSEEEIKKFWNKFSELYYISCSPYEDSIDQRKDIPEIHEILKRFKHTADFHPIEILIGKYNEETIAKEKEQIENLRKEFEWTEITVQDPKNYMYIVWFFGGSQWRANEYIISEIKKMFSDKTNTIDMKS